MIILFCQFLIFHMVLALLKSHSIPLRMEELLSTLYIKLTKGIIHRKFSLFSNDFHYLSWKLFNVETETSFLLTCILLADMHTLTTLVQSHGPLCAYLAATFVTCACVMRCWQWVWWPRAVPEILGGAGQLSFCYETLIYIFSGAAPILSSWSRNCIYFMQ